MGLNEYRRKRKFNQTPEPAGKIKKAKGKLRFVVQKHAATRTHFDFRLELDGVLLSWAVPKGPSMSPLDQRLAVRVEDHPMEYGSFEGVIPKGNYGAGTVMVWDTGSYESRQAKGRDASEPILRKGLVDGKLTLVLRGKKLAGEFALVRIHGRDPKAWLLIKKRDAAAVDSESFDEDRSALTGRTMEEIAEQSVKKRAIWIPGKGKVSKRAAKEIAKPPKPQAPKKTVEKPMPHAIRPMQAVIAAKEPEKENWIFELSWEGHRAIAEVEKGRVRLYSRALLPLDRKFPKIVNALKGVTGVAILDGEILPKREEYVIYDLLYLNGEDLRPLPLRDRKDRLHKLPIFGKFLIESSHSSDWKKVAEKAKKEKLESLLAKKKESVYQSGIHRDWVKVRLAGFGQDDKKTRAVNIAKPNADLPPLTNLKKIFWPKEKYTKGDVVRYYDSMSSYLLPYLKDRPQSLHRQPDGLKNEGFFHKDMVGYLPRRIETVRIESGSANKTIHYLLCQDRWTLLYMANLGCIELNPWLSRVGHLDKPDLMVIDLDPDDNPFSEVVEAALEVRKLFDSMKVESFCKTSGASGIHICVPLGARYEYEFVRKFAEAVCTVIHNRLPDFTSILRNPARRKGKLYLDFLQNRRGQTLAAPYCIRPRPKATVSTPLRWNEVKRGLDPRDFTIETIAKRVAKVGDLWKPTLGRGVALEGPMKQLSKLLQN